MQYINAQEWEHSLSTIRGLVAKLEQEATQELQHVSHAAELNPSDLDEYRRIQQLFSWTIGNNGVYEIMDVMIRVLRDRTEGRLG